MTPRELQALVDVRALCSSGEAKRLRQAAGLRLSEVGDSVGVTASTVTRWENRHRRPTGPTAIRYAALLEMLARMEAKA